jgi:hypothetical protein
VRGGLSGMSGGRGGQLPGCTACTNTTERAYMLSDQPGKACLLNSCGRTNPSEHAGPVGTGYAHA